VPNRLMINLRGAGGSGKTTTARFLLEHKVADLPPLDFTHRPGGSKGPAKPGQWPVAKCVVPGLELPVYVQGSYRQAQGGCDTCKDMDAIEALIWRAANEPEMMNGHIFWEGMMVSGSAERWSTFSTRVAREGLGHYLWVFLRMPKDELIRRVMERNGGKMPQVQYYDENMKKQERSRNQAKALWGNRWVVDLDPLQPPADVYRQFVVAVGVKEQMT
jgi:hypothetical protein